MKQNSIKQKDSIILLSGGVDSTTLLYEYSSQIAIALSFDYGSKHNSKEIAFAAYHCQKLNIKHIVIDLDFMNKHFASSLLKSGCEIPEGEYNEKNMASTVVPFRNGIMLSIAAGLAESNHLDHIMIANHHGDHAIYPDCRASFIKGMSTAISEGTTNKVSLLAPYTHISKGEIALHGKKLNIEYDKTWSCYKGEEFHCGKCGTCLERIEAFQFAQISDTTSYV